jgi:hypothetical protein
MLAGILIELSLDCVSIKNTSTQPTHPSDSSPTFSRFITITFPNKIPMCLIPLGVCFVEEPKAYMVMEEVRQYGQKKTRICDSSIYSLVIKEDILTGRRRLG